MTVAEHYIYIYTSVSCMVATCVTCPGGHVRLTPGQAPGHVSSRTKLVTFVFVTRGTTQTQSSCCLISPATERVAWTGIKYSGLTEMNVSQCFINLSPESEAAGHETRDLFLLLPLFPRPQTL